MKNNHKFARLALPVLIVLIVGIGATIAYIFTTTATVNNSFAPSEPDITVEETYNEANNVKSNVFIKNSNDKEAIKVYVRVMLVKNWYRAGETDSYIAGKTDWEFVEANKVSGEKILNIDNNEGWFYCATDGYYYYKYILAEGASTSALINKLALLEDVTDSTYQGIEIIAEAIQAEGKSLTEETGGASGLGKSPVELAWGVTLNSDGTISK